MHQSLAEAVAVSLRQLGMEVEVVPRYSSTVVKLNGCEFAFYPGRGRRRRTTCEFLGTIYFREDPDVLGACRDFLRELPNAVKTRDRRRVVKNNEERANRLNRLVEGSEFADARFVGSAYGVKLTVPFDDPLMVRALLDFIEEKEVDYEYE